jgi:GxxExxY protein
MTWESDPLTKRIIGGIIEVHRTIGPGFLESVYRNALLLELISRGLRVENEREVPILYLDRLVGMHRLDLVVKSRVILELKAVESPSAAHYGQLRSYLRASGQPLEATERRPEDRESTPRLPRTLPLARSPAIGPGCRGACGGIRCCGSRWS